MDQLFMLEVLVQKIRFEDLPVPQKKDIVVQATWGHVASLEIRTDVMGGLQAVEAKERSARKKDIDIDCGRSVVFPIRPKELSKFLKDFPLEVSVSTKLDMEPIGVTQIPWNSDFADMVATSAESQGYLTPVYLIDTFTFSRNGKGTGEITVFIRLSYLGRNIMTQIQRIPVKDEAGAAKYLFKSTDNATTFECRRFGVGSDTDIIPVAPLYITATIGGKRSILRPMRDGKSTESIFTRESIYERASVAPSVFNINLRNQSQDMGAFFNSLIGGESIRQLRGIRDQKMYLDLRELHMDVSSFQSMAGMKGLHYWKEEEPEDEGEETVLIDYKSLTAKEIEKRLCSHPDCPAAKLFKDYGIGPLAKRCRYKGVGGIYNNIEPPLTYGLSHCNGTIENYGPLGKFRKSRNLEDSYSAPNVNLPSLTDSARSIDKGINCKKFRQAQKQLSKRGSLKGGSSEKDDYFFLMMNSAALKHHYSAPMRLRGGGVESPVIPNPFNLCQDLMNEFEKVLQEYKNALGPCGKTTCPFNMNNITNACQTFCSAQNIDESSDFLKGDSVHSIAPEEYAGCGLLQCPHKRAIGKSAGKANKKFLTKPACGNINCPFLKARLGMEDDDDENMYLYPGGPKLYKFTDNLPPIHWDCPEPLPKGDCKNPDCPFIKKESLIKKYFPDPSECSPCGRATCPYVCVPCTFAGCPFVAPQKCPPTCPYINPTPINLKCTPSVCPFARPPEVCQNTKCPYKNSKRLSQNVMGDFKTEPAIVAYSQVPAPELPTCLDPTNSSHKYLSALLDAKDCENLDNNFEDLECGKESQSVPCVLAAAALVDGCPCGKKSYSENLFRGFTSGEFKKGKKEEKPRRKSFKTSLVKFRSKERDNAGKIVYRKVDKLRKTGKRTAERIKNKFTVAVFKGKYYQAAKCKKMHFRFDRRSYVPCTKIGHRDCVMPKFLVPKDMGWLWNVHTNYCGLRPRRGWKPGAVSKEIAERIDEFNRNLGIYVKPKDSKAALETPANQTIHIQQKNGVVNVTMNPVKDAKDLVINKKGIVNPYMDCTPIKFKITDPENQDGKCHCGQVPYEDSSSELSIEFSPPAALVDKKNILAIKQVADKEIQYDIKDIPLPKERPKSEKGKTSKKGKKGKKK